MEDYSEAAIILGAIKKLSEDYGSMSEEERAQHKQMHDTASKNLFTSLWKEWGFDDNL